MNEGVIHNGQHLSVCTEHTKGVVSGLETSYNDFVYSIIGVVINKCQ